MNDDPQAVQELHTALLRRQNAERDFAKEPSPAKARKFLEARRLYKEAIRRVEVGI